MRVSWIVSVAIVALVARRAEQQHRVPAGSTSDVGGVFSAIQAMATQGCHAGILVDKSGPTPPPIKSFRPLASF